MKKNKNINKKATANTVTTTSSASRLPLIISLLLFVAVVCVYYQATYNKFVFDDDEYLVRNLHIQRGLTWDTIKWAFTSNYASNWHPLTWISHTIDAQLYIANPTGHHLTSILFHAMNTVLLFLLLSKLTRSKWKSAFVAAVFGLHPLHVESVAWISERKDVLSTFFWFCTILAYLGYVRTKSMEIIGKSRHRIYYAGMIVLYILALLSKGMPVTLPFTLLILDYWPIQRKNSWKSLVIEKIPLFVLSAGSCFATYFAQKNHGAVVDSLSLPFTVRAANAFVSYIIYIRQMFWPVNLAAYYPHMGKHLPVWQVMGSILLLIAMSYAVLRARKVKYLAAGWLLYLITLIPVIGFVQVGGQSHADRYTYIPLIGLFMILAWGVPELLSKVSLFGKEKTRCIVLSLCAAIILASCAFATQKDIYYWKDNYTLFSHAIKVTNNNWIAHGAISRELLLRKDYKGALYHAKEAIQINPTDPNWRITMGTILTQTGKNEAAVEQFKIAIALKPKAVLARINMAMALDRLGRKDEAINQLKRAIKYEPDNVLAQSNLAGLLAREGDYKEAISHYEIASNIKGNEDINVLINLAEAHAKLGQFKEAISIAKQAMAIAESTNKQNMADILNERLELYTKGKAATGQGKGNRF